MCNSNLSVLTYDRNVKEWQISSQDGFYKAFPAGTEGKRAAVQAGIQHDDPQLYAAAFYLAADLFRHHPAVQSRVWNAALGIISGRYFAGHPLAGGSTAAHVAASSNDGRFHTIRKLPSRQGMFYDCSCPDFVFSGAPVVSGQPLCKHILAVKLHKITQRPLPAFLESPRQLMPYLEETGAAFEVIGVYNHSTYTAYPQPIRRPAVIGEVVQVDGRFLRLIGGHSKISTYDVTAEIYQPQGRGLAGMRRSTSAHLTAAHAASPEPRPAVENEQLTAALKSMTAAARRNYSSHAKMTDLSPAEIDELLF